MAIASIIPPAPSSQKSIIVPRFGEKGISPVRFEGGGTGNSPARFGDKVGFEPPVLFGSETLGQRLLANVKTRFDIAADSFKSPSAVHFSGLGCDTVTFGEKDI